MIRQNFVSIYQNLKKEAQIHILIIILSADFTVDKILLLNFDPIKSM